MCKVEAVTWKKGLNKKKEEKTGRIMKKVEEKKLFFWFVLFHHDLCSTLLFSTRSNHDKDINV